MTACITTINGLLALALIATVVILHEDDNAAAHAFTVPPSAVTTATTASLNNQSFKTSLYMFESTTTSKTEDAVDRNDYNLSLEKIAEEWTAEVVPESSIREGGIFLGAKTPREIMVDTIKVQLTRQVGKGLGLELLEIAGGREDGLGIVVVDGILDDSIAKEACPQSGDKIMVGDSIVALTVVKKTTNGQDDDNVNDFLSESEEAQSVGTECYGYDKLVEAIGSLPPPESNDEKIVLTLKRLRRKPKVLLTLQYPPSQNEPDTTLELFSGENLRRAMLTRGVKLNDPLSERFDSGGLGDCGAEGTCATCVVNIVEGSELLNKQKIQEEQILRKNPRWRFACKAIVGYGDREGKMTIKVNPRQWKLE
mmetsp:Transcript_14194/g.34206  ORF Transcript_14194/g.34206 Transcript_14194/m.34206 type:complete len:367 (-) Transcript_14194:97-1197(-)